MDKKLLKVYAGKYLCLLCKHFSFLSFTQTAELLSVYDLHVDILQHQRSKWCYKQVREVEETIHETSNITEPLKQTVGFALNQSLPLVELEP